MSEPETNANSADPLFQPWADYWSRCVRETSRWMRDRAQVPSSPLEGQKQWFETLTQQTDQYLRSPLFLHGLKTHIEALIQAKRQATPAGAGQETISHRWQGFEESMRAEMQELRQRLEFLEQQAGEANVSDGWERFLGMLEVSPSHSAPAMGTTPYDVVYRDGLLRLLRYRSSKVAFAEPVLICFALVNRPYILDLQAERSVVRRFLDRGFDVFLIDWGVPTAADRHLRLEDYVCRMLSGVVDFVCETTHAPHVSLLGYCMGGTMSTMFTALNPDRVGKLILMATPIDFATEEGLLNLWARKEFFDVDQLIDAFGNCPGEFLQYCFQVMKPVQNFAEKYLTFYGRLDDNAFLDNFFAMERWANDSIPVAGETFRDYVKMLYQQNQLAQGEMVLGPRPVQLQNIRCPLLLLTADQDHLVPPSSTLALESLVSSQDVESMSIAAGHIGLAVSSKAHRQLWPAVTTWLEARSTSSVAQAATRQSVERESPDN